MTLRQIEKQNPVVQAPLQNSRAQLFVTKAMETNRKILTKIIAILAGDTALSPQEFVQKNISGKDPSEIDRRTAILYKTIVADLYVQINHVGILQGLIIISIATKKDEAAGQFIKEVSLPFVRELVQDLDSSDRGIIDEATASDVAPEMEERLTRAHLNLNSRIL